MYLCLVEYYDDQGNYLGDLDSICSYPDLNDICQVEYKYPIHSKDLTVIVEEDYEYEDGDGDIRVGYKKVYLLPPHIDARVRRLYDIT